MDLKIVLVILAFLVVSDCQEEIEEESPELHPLDGYFNNLLHPDWGAVDTVLLRKSPPAYADGVYTMAGQNRPNPFDISERAHRSNIAVSLGSARGRTAMQVYFGQQVVEEIMDSQRPGCPREYENIPVPKNNTLYRNSEAFNSATDTVFMPFPRSRFDQRTGQSPSNPRQQLNEITPYLDGQLMYGPARTWTDAIREFRGGKLLVLDPSKGVRDSLPAINDIRLPFANPPNPRENTRERRLLPVARFWRFGNPRAMENPFLLSFGVLWFRWHNYLAEEYIKMKNIQESDLEKYDEQIFNYARKWVVASHQKIVMYDWLPRWILTADNFTSVSDDSKFYPIRDPKTNDPRRPTCGEYVYNPNIHPGITAEFQTAAMRYGHTLVTPGLWRRGRKGAGGLQDNCNWFPTNLRLPNPPVQQTHGLRLCNAYWNSQEAVEDDLDALYRGLASTLGEKEDHIMVEDLAGQVFGPLEFSRRDLAALNIQRARDHGLTDYQTIRETFGLPRLNSWGEINTQNGDTIRAIEALRLLYEGSGLNGTSPEDVDLFAGGLMETTEDGPGDLFRIIMVEQFCRIRDGDRFWYENINNKIFNQTEIDFINNNITLGYILSKVTNLRVEGQRDSNGNVVDINNADIQKDPFVHRGNNDPCEQPAQLDPGVPPQVIRTSNATGALPLIENCTAWQTFDYFFGMDSHISFPFTFIWIGLVVPATIGVMLLMARQRQKKMMEARKKRARTDKSTDPNTFNVVEWVGKKEGERNVVIKFDSQRKKLHVNDRRGKPLRMIDLRPKQSSPGKSIRLWNADDRPVLSVRAEGEIDLVLKFADVERKSQFSSKLKNFAEGIGASFSTNNFAKAELIFNSATTKEDRQKLLDKFFRVICLQAFKDKTSKDLDLENLDHDTAKKIAEIQLTRTEFAEALGLKPTSIFVRNMFLLVDSDRSGFVSFREFLDFFVVLSSQDAESKIHLIFSMYDIQRRGRLSKKDFANMIKSLLDLSDSTLDDKKMEELVTSMYKAANISYGSDITFEDFKRIFASDEYAGTLQKATLNLDAIGDIGQPVKTVANTTTIRSKRATIMKNYTQKGAKKKGFQRQQSVVRVTTHQQEYPKTPLAQKMYEITSYISSNRLEIFWGTLFTLVLIGIFLERAFYYSFEREHAGLRRIAGYGVTVTRGAASAMMFTYCALLITMSRNMITFFRETFLHRFFPWDSMHAFHKFIAYQALLSTFIHVIGHGINLYHISTQTSGDANCYFMEYFRATHILASFHYWTYTTITGVTGILLTLIVIVMYVFATPYARRNAFNAFWNTHNLYIFLYIFMIMHGLGRLVQAPITHTYLIGPLFIYIIDKLISLSRKKIECRVVKAELLPSDVTALVFQRPTTFDYKSGQWVRIACLELGENEYHPFTISSAPHEEYLSLHIRAVGPWTYNLRNLYDPDNLEGKLAYPSVYVDGPYGEGHQDWYRYEVAILVGGGIGVTPFASILKDIVHKSKIADLRFPCKKVYFLWVTRTQKQFEWMTDIIREVENVDSNQFMDTHIFVTQFKEKFDLRTTMLYICERHFQKVAGKSLFTGLSAVTHFGRPNFQDFLKSVRSEHPNVRTFGVFSCGPPNMTNNLDGACTNLNKQEGATFNHHFENF